MKKEKIFSRNDGLLLGAFLVLALLGMVLVSAVTNKPGNAIRVTLSGECIGEYKLMQDAQFRLQGIDGYNVIKIKDGRVSVIEADCPDGYCVKHKPIGHGNEMIVCLPHRIVIEVINDKKAQTFDTIAE